MDTPHTVPGLEVQIDKLMHYQDPDMKQDYNAHAFIYFLTIKNNTPSRIKIWGRRWVLSQKNGHTFVLEGEGVIGKMPVLNPGDHFSYNSYHLIGRSTLAVGSFHGMDASGHRVYTRIPPFEMIIPDQP